MVQRPFWDWGRHFATDLLHSPRLLRLLPVLLEDFIPNLLGNPSGCSGPANSSDEPIWSVRCGPSPTGDSGHGGLVRPRRTGPRSAFDELRHAAGVDGVVVEGAHAWLIADPTAFGELAISALVDSGALTPAADRPRGAAADRPVAGAAVA